MSEIEVRVGDRERAAVDERLREAVGDGVLTLAEYDERAGLLWQTRTRRELDALVADLPVAHVPAARYEPVRPVRVVAVMSEERVARPVQPGQEVTGWAVMGKAVVDLRREDLPDGVQVRVRAVMAEVEVQVPPGSQVVLSGTAVMGDRTVRVAPGDGPVVHVDAYAVMGSVQVTVGDGSVVPRQAGAGRTAAVAARPAAPARRGRPGRGGSALVAAALAAGALVGVGQVAAAGDDARAVFGSAVERVVEPADGDVVEVSVLFGSVEVVVPDGVRVDLDGTVVFGGTACDSACSGTGDGPRITVEAVGGFGSVEVVTASQAD